MNTPFCSNIMMLVLPKLFYVDFCVLLLKVYFLILVWQFCVTFTFFVVEKFAMVCVSKFKRFSSYSVISYASVTLFCWRYGCPIKKIICEALLIEGAFGFTDRIAKSFFLVSLEGLGSFLLCLSIYHRFHIWHAAIANFHVVSIG